MYRNTDVYISEYRYNLDSENEEVLVYLYTPIMGHLAYNIYKFLVQEAKRMNRFHTPCSMGRIATMVNDSLTQVEESIKLLEALSLIRTYKKENQYLYKIQSPLTSQQFFHHVILSTYLRRIIGEEEFNITKLNFRISGEDLSEYKELTTKFSDIFQMKANYPLHDQHEYKDKEKVPIKYEYNMDIFNELMMDYQIPKSIIEKHYPFITMLAYTYNIDNVSLAKITRQSIKNNQLDKEAFKNSCRNYGDFEITKFSRVMQSQPIQNYSQVQDDLEGKHIRYLESISPYEYLSASLGGKQPPLHDLRIVEVLMLELDINPGVINVLLEYSMKRNDGHINRSFIESIAAAWVRRGVKNAREAINLLKTRKDKIDQAKIKDNIQIDKVETLDDKQKLEIEKQRQEILSLLGGEHK